MKLPTALFKDLHNPRSLDEFRKFIKKCIKRSGYPVFDIEKRLIGLASAEDVYILKGTEKNKMYKCFESDPLYAGYFEKAHR